MELDKLKDMIKNVPDKLQNIVKPAAGGTNLKMLKSELDEKRNEKIKTYGFIGMEVYDLASENRIDIPQVKGYIDKMNELNAAIEELEHKIADVERSNENQNICSCGYKLKPEDKFCPNCGEAVVLSAVICVCGAEVSRDSRFCQSCGRKMEDIVKINDLPAPPPMKECICGAKVPADQFMCMECGRKLE